jgi:hypothetical protein
MRRLSERNIPLLPALVDECEIPISIRHIRYADFTDSYAKGLRTLRDAILPLKDILDSLKNAYNDICLICDTIVKSEEDTEIMDELHRLNFLLAYSLRTRAQIKDASTNRVKAESC